MGLPSRLLFASFLLALAGCGEVEWLRWDEAGLTLPAPPVPRPEGTPAFVPPRWPLRPMHLVVLIWLGGLVATRARTWEPWAWGAAALAVRLLQPARIFMGVDYAYARWADGTGAVRAIPIYGETWPAFMGLFWWVSGGVRDHVQHLDLLLSAGMVAGVWTFTRHVADRRTAHLAAALLAAAPLPVALAHTETMFVLVAALQVALATSVLVPRPAHTVLAVSSALLLLELRPLQGLVVAVVGLWVLWQGRRALGASLLALVAATGLSLLARYGGVGLADATESDKLSRWFDPSWMFGRGGSLVLTDAAVTPLALSVAALAAWRSTHRHAATFALLLAVASALPYLHFERPTDVLRYQLPTTTWWCVLAALGLVASGPWVQRAFVLAALLGWAAAIRPLGVPFIWQVEDQLLRDSIDQGALRGRRVAAHLPWDKHEAFQTWANTYSGGMWVLREPGGGADRVWLGRGDAWPDAPPCRATAPSFEPRADTVEPVTGPVRIGLVDGCGPAPIEGDDR